MQLKELPIKKLFAIIFTGLAFSVAILFYHLTKNLDLPVFQLNLSKLNEQAQSSLTAPSKQEKVNFGLPTRLKIPGINVDSAVEQVGLASDRITMDVPKSPNDVAWYDLGPRPGEKGSAVIAGHYDWKNGAPAIFVNLDKLRPGDKLYIEDDKGVAINFVVRESRSYDPKADASNVFSSSDGQAHLNLITCEGVWDKVSQSYPKRLVVFTDKK